MRVVTATEASRSFAALLDEAERGETVVVTRAGRRIASIGPAQVGNGAEVLAILAPHDVDAQQDVDDGFADDVRSVRDAITLEDVEWPDD